MPHMLAQEHMGYVEALRYGTARNQATWAAALSAIGATPAMLALTLTGDGVWTVTSNFTSPANVITFIPPGVTVNIPTGVTVTLNGPIISYNQAWQTGVGTLQRGATNATEISALTALNVQINRAGEGLRITNPTTGAYVSLLTNTGLNSNLPVIQFVQQAGVNASNWEIGNYLQSSVYEWYLARPTGLPRLAMNNVGLWVSNGSSYTTPAHLLHLQLDDAFKPGDGTWDFPSDINLKTVLRLYTDGLAMLRRLPRRIVFVYNGKGGIPADGREYIGMAAQDVRPVAPYMIETYQDKLNPEDSEPTELLKMKNGAMVYALTNAMCEVADRLEGVEAALASLQTLTARVEALETALATATQASSTPPEGPTKPIEAPTTPIPRAGRRRHR